ncbi:hypothetical protein HRbin15_01980 [bacterium HR15]|nr:hypothetical protein HRbin15_01980 [bacterium HR15]
MPRAAGLLGWLLLMATALADGYLWLSGAGASPANLYRYNLRTGQIDRIVSPADSPSVLPSEDYNHLAYDGTYLYIGAYDQLLLAKAHPYTGDILQVGAYQNCECFLGGRNLRDGAFGRGMLWRATPQRVYPAFGLVLAHDSEGELLEAYYASGAGIEVANVIGLEWVGANLYGTTRVGFLRLLPMEAQPFYEFIEYALQGVPQSHTLGGLALDASTGRLYLATASPSEAALWQLQVDDMNATANATLVARLTDVGYPVGLSPTALGWVPAQAGDVNGDGCVDDSDLLMVLFAFGQTGSHLLEDLNEDGVVDDGDLLLVLFNFGNGC